MLAAARLLEIEEQFGEYIRSIVPLELDGETLRLILTHLANFPHHKHVGRREDRQPSFETCLEDVVKVIIPELPK